MNPKIKQVNLVIKKLQLVRDKVDRDANFSSALWVDAWNDVWSESDDLGLDNFSDLCVWIDENPKKWGGENGYKMFEKFNADDKTYFDGIIAQWQLIRDNLIKLEQ